ncbi:MAG: hypothetical protein U9Q83_07510 [Bacteroidota bacterium]|nr:hypothetical protein [Bacteroidota bacterium]
MSTNDLATALLTNHVCDNCKHKTLFVYSIFVVNSKEVTNNPVNRCSLKINWNTGKYKVCPRIRTCKKWSKIIEK